MKVDLCGLSGMCVCGKCWVKLPVSKSCKHLSRPVKKAQKVKMKKTLDPKRIPNGTEGKDFNSNR